MPSSSELQDAEYWRKRADEARAVARVTMNARSKSLMLGIATSYDEIAKSCEKIAHFRSRARDAKQRGIGALTASLIGDL